MIGNPYVIAELAAFLLLVLIALAANQVDKRRKAKYAQQQAQPSPAPVSTQVSTTTSGPSASPPAPAPAAAQKINWGWITAVVVLGIVVVVWVIIPALRIPTPPPAPKKELQQHVLRRDLKFVGGDGAIEKDGFVGIRKNGHVAFTTWDLPWRKDAVYHVVFCVLRRTTGYDRIEINGRSGEISCEHYGSEKFETVVFFERDMPGDPKYFNPGINQIKFWSPGDDVIVQSASIEMIYRE